MRRFGGFIGNWFIGCVFLSLEREVRVARGDGLRWWSVGFSALSVGSVPTPSPLRVYEGSFSRRFFLSPSNDGCPVFLPSVAFPFVFARLSPLVELLAAWTWTVALASVIA